VWLILTHKDCIASSDWSVVVNNAASFTSQTLAHISLLENYTYPNDGKPNNRIDLPLLQTLDSILKYIDANIITITTDKFITILEATYFKTSDPDYKCDVTQILTKLVAGKKKFHINPTDYNKVLGGDPFKGNNKTLQVVYSFMGQNLKKEVTENRALDLP